MNKDTQAAILRAAGRFISKRLEALEPRFKALETRALVPGPAGEKGAPGEPAPAPDFETVKLAVAAIAPPVIQKHFELEKAVFAERAEAFLKALPVAVGEKGERGEPGPAGERGADGKSVSLDDLTPLMEVKFAQWQLEIERRAFDVLQKAIDKMPVPKDGRNGADGVGWDDMQVEHDGKRTISLKFTKGDVQRVAEIVIPCVLDAGFYKDDMQLEKGDGVTFGGSYWISQKDAPQGKPEIGNPDFRLAVKKGRDGKRD